MQPQLANDVVKKATSKREAEIRASVLGKKCFLGAATIKAQNIYSSPRWQKTRRDMSSRLSCRDKWRRIEQLAVLEDFVREHREIRQRYMAGDKTVVFAASGAWMGPQNTVFRWAKWADFADYGPSIH